MMRNAVLLIVGGVAGLFLLVKVVLPVVWAVLVFLAWPVFIISLAGSLVLLFWKDLVRLVRGR